MLHQSRRIVTAVVGTASILLTSEIGLFSTSPNRSLNLSFNSIAWADTSGNSTFQYVPPQRGTPKSTQGTGSRGCTQSTPVTLGLLVPNDHNGQTISEHPTFFLYVSDKSSVPVEFALVEPGVAKPLYVKQIQVEKGGIVQVALPKELAALEQGKKYRWSASLICDANRPSNNVFVQSWIQRVPISSDLSEKLAAVTSNGESSTQTLQQQARIFGEKGLWYDALTALSKASVANPNDPTIKADFLSLLSQGGLSHVVAQQQQAFAKQ